MNEQPEQQPAPKKIKLPKCPYCKTVMRPVTFHGYYDEFDCWFCECVDLPNAETEKGGFVS